MIGHAIGPVWETNHVWLIFTIVLLFTCFPPAFADLSTGLYAPLTFALVGIVLRGAAFVSATTPRQRRGSRDLDGRLRHRVDDRALLLRRRRRRARDRPLRLDLAVRARDRRASPSRCARKSRPCSSRSRRDAARCATTSGAARFARRSRVWVLGLVPACSRATRAGVLRRAAGHRRRASRSSRAMLLGIAVMVCVARRRETLARIAAGAKPLAVLARLVRRAGARRSSPAAARSQRRRLAARRSGLPHRGGLGAVVLIPSLFLLFAVFKGPLRSPLSDQRLLND